MSLQTLFRRKFIVEKNPSFFFCANYLGFPSDLLKHYFICFSKEIKQFVIVIIHLRLARASLYVACKDQVTVQYVCDCSEFVVVEYQDNRFFINSTVFSIKFEFKIIH